jgi:spermidine synthase
VYRGKELLVFQRDGYQGFVFKRSPNLIQGWQSLKHPLDFRSEFVEMQIAATMCVPRPRRVAVLGLGLGTVPRSLQSLYPPIAVEAVEIHQEVVDVARNYFGLRPSETFRVSVVDASSWVERAPTDHFDAVYVDLFSREGLCDFVSTDAFIDQLARILRPGGLICFNLIRGRRLNRTIGKKLNRLTHSLWTMSGVRKSNMALFGVKGERIDPLVSLNRAMRVDRMRILPFRLNRHIRRMERVYDDTFKG